MAAQIRPRSATESLEDAQRHKLQRFIDNAHTKPTDDVLEIGTGWGSFVIQAVQQTGCTVAATTLSPEQCIRAAGLAHRITLQQTDYRDLQIPATGPYGNIISIETLEAVGAAHLETYFAGIDRLLKRDGGVAVFQCIAIPNARHATYARSDDFIRYIFPGGHLPAVARLVSAIAAGSRGALVVDGVENRTTRRRCGCGARRSCASSARGSGQRCGASMRDRGAGRGGFQEEVGVLFRVFGGRVRWAMLWLLWRGRARRS